MYLIGNFKYLKGEIVKSFRFLIKKFFERLVIRK